MNSDQAYISNESQYRLMSFFNYYRLALAILLLVLLQTGLLNVFQSSRSEFQTLTITSGLYLVLCGLGMMVTERDNMSQSTILAIMITDVLLLTVISKTTGGVEGGFANLILVSVAAGSFFLVLKNSLFLAAIASSGVVYTELISSFGSSSASFLRAALLGVSFFAVTILIQYILNRVRISEELAKEHAESVIDLQHINEQVIQRMRTGIIVCRLDGHIKMINQSAITLITNDASINNMDRVPDILITKIGYWRKTKANQLQTLRFNPKLPDTQISISSLQGTDNSDLLIFLEDSSQIKQQAQQMKLASLGRLTASIAHEIRNPLGAISHAAQLMSESTQIDPTDLRMIEIIENHTQRMNSIIENVLQLSRQSRSTPELFDLGVWIEQFKAEYFESHPQCSIDIQCPDNLQIRFDQSQLQQIVSNLVTNGLRYSAAYSKEERVEIQAGILNANDQPYLDVIDFGPGLTEEQKEHIFEPFYTTENSGTGLGLFICKELCEANQSRLEWVPLTQETNTGCRFRILFVHPQREQMD